MKRKRRLEHFKKILILGILSAAASTFVMAASFSIFTAVLPEQGLMHLPFAVTADLSHSGGEGRKMSIITMGFLPGNAAESLIGGLLTLVFFELPSIAPGILCLVATLIIYKYLPETVVSKKAIFKHES